MANIHVVANTSARLAGVCAILKGKHSLVAEILEGADGRHAECPVVVIQADLGKIENVAALIALFHRNAREAKRIFLIDKAVHLHVAQAYALGASSVIVGRTYHQKLLATLSEYGGSLPSCLLDTADGDAISFGATAIASMFKAAGSRSPLDLSGIDEAGSRIADHIAERGLSNWLATVRDHHEGTYQHCLLVTGVAIDFAFSLGMRKRDIQRMYSAAMLHDIGKAVIPLAIIDKPGRLVSEERAIIETHPALGFDLLKDEKAVSPEVLDAVRHHHEYLDGSGYPDKLRAEQITDIVRLLTISDIFAALIEDRRYKPPMPRDEAYDILCRMDGKLEKVLVSAFREVALVR